MNMDEEFSVPGFQEHSNMLYNQPDFNDGFLMDNNNVNQNDNQYASHQFSQQYSNNHESSQGKRTRASGEVLALLISEFNRNPNPNQDQRKKLSEQTNMPERSVRIWFQNRRAKSRKLEKAQTNDREDRYSFDNIDIVTSRYDNIPLNLNNNYYFIESKSVTVGSWKRLKSGHLGSEHMYNVKNLSNLSPSSINDIMTNSTDLMIVISKKNFEINYFFSAITENSKILFRIFYPISSVNDCSLSINTEEDGQPPTCETKIYLNKPPQFAVSFTKLIGSQGNQWSICEDFSEGHQVNDAFIGGSGVPHVFNGLLDSLKFMNSFILDYNSSNVQQREFSLPQRFNSRSPTHFQANPSVAQKMDIHPNTDAMQSPTHFQDNPSVPQEMDLHPNTDPMQSQHQPSFHQLQSPQQDPNNIPLDSNADFLNQFVPNDLVDVGNDTFEAFIQQTTNESNLMLGLNGDDPGVLNHNDY